MTLSKLLLLPYLPGLVLCNTMNILWLHQFPSSWANGCQEKNLAPLSPASSLLGAAVNTLKDFLATVGSLRTLCPGG